MISTDALFEIRAYLLNLIGAMPHGGYSCSLDRMIRERMRMLDCSQPLEYLLKLKEEAGERDICIKSVTINETYFFREPAYLSLITETIIPRLLRKLPNITILSAGCSTGAEAYSVAISLYEKFGPDIFSRCRIIGIDVDKDALRTARSGVYTPYTLRGMKAEKKQRYFNSRDDRSYEIQPEIRRGVSFSHMNLMDRKAMEELIPADVILYRNVSIYLNMESRIQVFTTLAERLSRKGILITGASETLAHDIGVLALVSMNGLFYFTHHSDEGPSVSHVSPRRPVTMSHAVLKPSIPEKKPFEQVVRAALNGEYAESLRQLDRIHPPAQLTANRDILRAGILYNLKRFDEALDTCNRVIKAEPLRIEGYLIKAMIHRLETKLEIALTEMKKVLYLERDCWIAAYYSAEMYHQLGEKRRARVYFHRVIHMMEQGTRKDYLLVFPLNRITGEQVIRLCRYALEKL